MDEYEELGFMKEPDLGIWSDGFLGKVCRDEPDVEKYKKCVVMSSYCRQALAGRLNQGAIFVVPEVPFAVSLNIMSDNGCYASVSIRTACHVR